MHIDLNWLTCSIFLKFSLLCSPHLLFFFPKILTVNLVLAFALYCFPWSILLRPIDTYIPIFLSFQAFPTHLELVSIFSTFIILPNHGIHFTVFLFESQFYYLVPFLQLIYSRWIVAVFYLRENSIPLVVQVISSQSTQCGTLELSSKFIYKHFEDPPIWTTLHIAL